MNRVSGTHTRAPRLEGGLPVQRVGWGSVTAFATWTERVRLDYLLYRADGQAITTLAWHPSGFRRDNYSLTGRD